jgi:hypothetical protein
LKNLAHSVRQRLLNRAKETGQPNEYILVRYALERLLYRLSISPHADRFLLKGALLFLVWGQEDHRPTRDADLLGFGPSDLGQLEAMFRELCAVPFEDGIVYDPASVTAAQIAEEKVYMGARVTFQAELAGAKIPVQIDIGFGDAVTPEPEVIEFPAMLEFPSPKLRAYSVYTVVAEKFHAMVILGLDNSRMKDFYDLWAITQRFDLRLSTLAQAIGATFERRRTPLPDGTPVALTPEFSMSITRQRQWDGFVRRSRLPVSDVTLARTQTAIAALVLPALDACRKAR